MKIIDKIKHSIRNYYVFYADTTELLDKTKKLLRPLPPGCELVKLTSENRNQYKCKWDIDLMLSVGSEAWAIVDNNEIVAWHYGTYRGKDSLFFKITNCDFEHVELLTDERYRRKGLGIYLLYHTVKNLDPEKVTFNRLGTCIKPDNYPSIKLHELIGFKKSHRVFLIHRHKKINGRNIIKNFPHYNI